jgi:hypothetical protein
MHLANTCEAKDNTVTTNICIAMLRVTAVSNSVTEHRAGDTYRCVVILSVSFTNTQAASLAIIWESGEYTDVL